MTPPASTTPSASSPCRLVAWVPLRLTPARSRSIRLARTRSRPRQPLLHPRRLVRASQLRAPRLPAGFHQVRAPHTAKASRAEFGPLPRRPAPPASPWPHPAPLAGSRPPPLPASVPPAAAESPPPSGLRRLVGSPQTPRSLLPHLAESDFWNMEYDHEAAKKARAKTKAAKKVAKKNKKKLTTSEMLELDDSSKSEVALDSLGSFFNYLIDNDYHQDDMGASQAVEEEDATAQLQSQLVDAKTRLENQEFESQKADSKFKFSLAETEKLKTSFDAERTTWAEEKTALTQRAEKAEAALQEEEHSPDYVRGSCRSCLHQPGSLDELKEALKVTQTGEQEAKTQLATGECVLTWVRDDKNKLQDSNTLLGE
nr:MAP7 domain-containing protein 1-like [Aegilops tauschii subsp. strangulata]